MTKYTVLYNPLANNNKGEENAKKLKKRVKGKLEFYKMPEVTDFKKFLWKHNNIILCGGDGTLNYFVNKTKGLKYYSNLFYYYTGTGNDFHNDIGERRKEPYQINKYLDQLPTTLINETEYKFINNVGFGLDGWVCETGEVEKKTKKRPINYTMLAIRGILKDYKPCNAHIKVDDKEYDLKNVWMAPTMNSRVYGGGMYISPSQDRLHEEGLLTLVVLHDISKIGLLRVLPLVFKGKHVDKKGFTFYTGKEITVTFDKPSSVQIDGEVIKNVTEYKVKSRKYM